MPGKEQKLIAFALYVYGGVDGRGEVLRRRAATRRNDRGRHRSDDEKRQRPDESPARRSHARGHRRTACHRLNLRSLAGSSSSRAPSSGVQFPFPVQNPAGLAVSHVRCVAAPTVEHSARSRARAERRLGVGWEPSTERGPSAPRR